MHVCYFNSYSFCKLSIEQVSMCRFAISIAIRFVEYLACLRKDCHNSKIHDFELTTWSYVTFYGGSFGSNGIEIPLKLTTRWR